MYELKDKEFEYITSRLYDYSKINLTERKRSLVVSRLSKRIRTLGLNSFKEYIEILQNSDYNGLEFQKMVNALSTNFSQFFREPYHFEFLNSEILPSYKNKIIKIWSAASSTGEEIYSLLMNLNEYQKNKKLKLILNLFASDISTDVLKSAAKGIYPRKEIENIDYELLRKYFLSGSDSKSDFVKIKNKYKKQIKFFKLNLNDVKYDIPQMDVIFLRNVIIYFDHQTKVNILERLHKYLKKDGYLFLGHSESLAGISDGFKLIGKTVYKRI